jgi:hypothetical protein
MAALLVLSGFTIFNFGFAVPHGASPASRAAAPRVAQPLVGSWAYDETDQYGHAGVSGLVTFHEDGTVLLTSLDAGNLLGGHGAWTETRVNRFVFALVSLEGVSSSKPSSLPREQQIRGAVEMRPGENAWTATIEIDSLTASGVQPVPYGPYRWEATRIAAANGIAATPDTGVSNSIATPLPS